MPSLLDLKFCQAKKGLLTLRDCLQPASATCHRCQRPVCPEHLVQTDTGIQCPECVAMDRTDNLEHPEAINRQPPAVQQSLTRRRYYSEYDYLPFYVGGSHYFSDSDYRSFDEGATQAAVAAAATGILTAEADADDSGSGRVEDFMES